MVKTSFPDPPVIFAAAVDTDVIVTPPELPDASMVVALTLAAFKVTVVDLDPPILRVFSAASVRVMEPAADAVKLMVS
jgi:hypothetical protein